MGENVCPVCGCGSLVEPAFNERGVGSDDICPCCGFQFGLDDFPYEDRERLIAEWRERWVAGGGEASVARLRKRAPKLERGGVGEGRAGRRRTRRA